MDGEQQPVAVNVPPTEPKSNKKLWWVVAGVVLVVSVGLVVYFVNKAGEKSSDKTSSSASAATQLIETLGNAAKQPRIHVGMYRETYANKADAEAKQSAGSVASSVSEIDAQTGQYRSVFAHNLLEEDQSFSVGRCMDDITYNEAYDTKYNQEPRATSLAQIGPHLTMAPQGHLYKVTEALTYISCPHAGILPSSPPLAVSRLSDGVFPVTFTEAKAANWIKKVESANLFNVKDEGIVEKDGQKLRKISFDPKSESGANKALYDIFYETGEIDKIKVEQPGAEWMFKFVTMNPLNTGSAGGFYLINEATKLPVYSELYSTNPDKKTGQSRSAGSNIARTKQSYAFPAQLSMDLNTPLEFVK